MVEAQRGSIETYKVINGVAYKKGDVVLVERVEGSEIQPEEGGIVHQVDENGHLLVSYGGPLAFFNDGDSIRQAPEEIREALEFRLKQNEEELGREVDTTLRSIKFILDEYHRPSLLSKAVNSLKTRLHKTRS